MARSLKWKKFVKVTLTMCSRSPSWCSCQSNHQIIRSCKARDSRATKLAHQEARPSASIHRAQWMVKACQYRMHQANTGMATAVHHLQQGCVLPFSSWWCALVHADPTLHEHHMRLFARNTTVGRKKIFPSAPASICPTGMSSSPAMISHTYL